MATSFASTTTAPRIPLGRAFPLPPVAHRNLTLVPKRNEVSQDSAPAFDILDFLNRFSPGKSRREYLTGEYVFSQGDTSNTVFYIQSGRVNLTLVSMSGKEAVIAHLPEGSFFGESALGGEPSRLCSASALQSAVIVRIEKTAMQGLLHSEQKFAHSFFEHLLARSIRMQADLVDHLFNSSEKRLARLLMMMANFGQKTQPIPVIEKISQETLADMIGTTRSRVSFFLNRFRSLGYIDYDCSGMRINSSLANIVLHD